jgi:L-aspartate oxidase
VCCAITRSGRHISARAVVIATGGIGHAYLTSTNPPSVRGDGIVLAVRAGATLVDLEFVQFHPTALADGTRNGQLPLVTEALRGEGAVLRDNVGAPIMARFGRRDLEPRDIVAREISAVLERDQTEHVWLDATGLDPATLRARFPTVVADCARIGIDPASEPIPVAPAEHFVCGGVRVDRNGRTDVPGLYAVGEAAATGVHGANRLASNSLLEGLAFGRRLATTLVLDLPPHADAVNEARLGTDHDAEQVRTILSRDAGIRRSHTGLTTASHELDQLGDGPIATLAQAIVTAAAARRESRGCHWRSDHPHASALGYRPILVRLDAAGRPTATTLSEAS